MTEGERRTEGLDGDIGHTEVEVLGSESALRHEEVLPVPFVPVREKTRRHELLRLPPFQLLVSGCSLFL